MHQQIYEHFGEVKSYGKALEFSPASDFLSAFVTNFKMDLLLATRLGSKTAQGRMGGLSMGKPMAWGS